MKVFSIMTTVLLVVAIFANSTTPFNSQRNSPVAVGEAAPDFSLEDQDGQKFNLSDARGKSSVLLVFYRGYW